MVKHIVMWNIKDTLDKTATFENLKTQLEALADKISVIIKIELGANYLSSESAHDIVLYSEFASKSALEEYVEHPEHKKVGEYVRSVVKDRVSVDYEL